MKLFNKLFFAVFAFALVLVSSASVHADGGVAISPNPANTNDMLSCSVNGQVSGYMFSWYKNGQLTGLNSYQVGAGNTSKGNVWKCEVRQNLGGQIGVIYIGSDQLSIQNIVPVMNTLTPGANACITGGRSVTISYSASDADNDALTYTISWGDSSANTVTASTTSTHLYPTAGGAFTVTVTASDGQSTSNVMTLPLNLAACAGPGTATVTLNSLQNNNMLNGLQTLVFNSVNYGTPNYVVLPTTLNNVANQVYNINYIAQPGFAFVNWVTTGLLTVASPNTATTTVNVVGNGTLTATYHDIQAPTATFIAPTPANGSTINVTCGPNTASVTFSVSITDNAGNAAPNIASVNLTLNGAVYPMVYVSGTTWTYTAATLAVGSYSYFATAADASGNTFTTPTQTFTVSNANCSGNIYTVNLADRNITNQTLTNVGNMTFNSISYTLPATIANIAGNTYSISYTPVSGFYFDHWENNMTTGTITFGNANSQSTTATVAGNGTIIAVYTNVAPPTNGGTNPGSGNSDSLLVYAQIANDEKAKIGDQTFVLVNMYNTENVDLKNMHVKVTIPDFPFTRTLGPFDLHPGWNSKQIYFDVPSNMVSGPYDVQVNVYNDSINRIKYRILTVLGDEKISEMPVSQPQIGENVPFINEKTPWALMVAFIFVLLLLIGLIVYAAKSKKKNNQL